MLEKLLLRHLDLLTKETIDFATLMVEVNGYVNKRFLRKRRFKKSFNHTMLFIQNVAKWDIKEIKYSEDTIIKRPGDIDSMSFKAMMELQTLANNPGERSTIELITETIAMALYHENNTSEFDLESPVYLRFKKRVSDSNALHMLGLYNWINEALDNSKNMWTKLFFDVEVTDKDYEMAGGEKMSAFNVITTIKALCDDFNVTYDQAWHLSYALSQINSLARATNTEIQYNMAEIKEGRMRAEAKKGK